MPLCLCLWPCVCVCVNVHVCDVCAVNHRAGCSESDGIVAALKYISGMA